MTRLEFVWFRSEHIRVEVFPFLQIFVRLKKYNQHFFKDSKTVIFLFVIINEIVWLLMKNILLYVQSTIILLSIMLFKIISYFFQEVHVIHMVTIYRFQRKITMVNIVLLIKKSNWQCNNLCYPCFRFKAMAASTRGAHQRSHPLHYKGR